MLIGVALTIYTNIELNNLLFWLVVLGGFLVGAMLARLIKMTEMSSYKMRHHMKKLME